MFDEQLDAYNEAARVMAEKERRHAVGQFDLFGNPMPVSLSPVDLREIQRFARLDAKTGLPLRNYYSERISGEWLAAYESAFRSQRALR
jgi:GGDEF domain-containing protein